MGSSAGDKGKMRQHNKMARVIIVMDRWLKVTE